MHRLTLANKQPAYRAENATAEVHIEICFFHSTRLVGGHLTALSIRYHKKLTHLLFHHVITVTKMNCVKIIDNTHQLLLTVNTGYAYVIS